MIGDHHRQLGHASAVSRVSSDLSFRLLAADTYVCDILARRAASLEFNLGSKSKTRGPGGPRACHRKAAGEGRHAEP